MTSETRRASPADSIAARETWIRGLLMLVFGFVLGFVQMVAGAVAVLQFAFLLLGGRANGNLRQFGRGLADYARAIVRFMTCDTEERPFPFSPWPADQP